MSRLFGTDGVRGVANESLKPDLALKVGLAIASSLQPSTLPLQVLIGRDTRRSGPMLEGALASALCAMGANVTSAGILPTPAVAYLVRNGDYNLGIAISASHNPAHHNGIKLIGHDGYKLPDAVEEQIEEMLRKQGMDYSYPPPSRIGNWLQGEQEAQRYHEFLLNLMRQWTADPLPLRGVRIAVDCANGAASRFAPALLKELGATVSSFASAPDGDNINAGCGSTHLEFLQKCVLEERVDLGVAFDGDADRALFCDEKGEPVDGDRVMAMWALQRHAAGKLIPPIVVATEMSNLGFEKRLRQEGITLERTRVGDRYVSEQMRAVGALVGGEQSGHIIFAERGTTGDGLVTLLEVLSLYLQSGKRFSEIAHPFEPVPQKLLSVEVRDKTGWQTHPAIQAQQSAIREQLGDRGRLSIRASGTENAIRVMVEAEDPQLLEECLQAMVKTIQQAMGQ